MVHRAADSRLLTNLLQQEKEYTKQLLTLLNTSNASLTSLAAYAAASPHPLSQVIMAVAGSLAAADDALRRYAHSVELWRETIARLKDMEDEVGNIIRDREILVTRLIKASKTSKPGSSITNTSARSSSSLTLSNNQDPSLSYRRSITFSTSSKLGAAQSELQACELHLAAKERELAMSRSAALREGLGARFKALVDCGWAWSELGKEGSRSLEVLQPHGIGTGQTDSDSFLIMPSSASGVSSISPSQSASQTNHPTEYDILPPVVHPLPSSETLHPPVVESNNFLRPTSMATTTATFTSSASGSGVSSPNAALVAATASTLTYAPAVAVHIPPSAPPSSIGVASGVPIHRDDNTGTPDVRLLIPAPHALGGHLDIPVAEIDVYAAATGAKVDPSNGRVFVRSGSPEKVGQVEVMTKSVAEEVSVIDSDKGVQGEDEEEEGESQNVELEVTKLQQDQSAQENTPRVEDQGLNPVQEPDSGSEEARRSTSQHLELVENPRFMSDKRRSEVEQESQRTNQEKGKKRMPFSSLHPQQTQPETPLSSLKTNDKNASSTSTSPSKSFLGSLRLKGIFSSKVKSSSPAKSSTPSRVNSRALVEDSSEDSAISDDENWRTPTKKKKGKTLQSFLFRSPEKKSATGNVGKWERGGLDSWGGGPSESKFIAVNGRRPPIGKAGTQAEESTELASGKSGGWSAAAEAVKMAGIVTGPVGNAKAGSLDHLILDDASRAPQKKGARKRASSDVGVGGSNAGGSRAPANGQKQQGLTRRLKKNRTVGVERSGSDLGVGSSGGTRTGGPPVAGSATVAKTKWITDYPQGAPSHSNRRESGDEQLISRKRSSSMDTAVAHRKRKERRESYVYVNPSGEAEGDKSVEAGDESPNTPTPKGKIVDLGERRAREEGQVGSWEVVQPERDKDYASDSVVLESVARKKGKGHGRSSSISAPTKTVATALQVQLSEETTSRSTGEGLVRGSSLLSKAGHGGGRFKKTDTLGRSSFDTTGGAGVTRSASVISAVRLTSSGAPGSSSAPIESVSKSKAASSTMTAKSTIPSNLMGTVQDVKKVGQTSKSPAIMMEAVKAPPRVGKEDLEKVEVGAGNTKSTRMVDSVEKDAGTGTGLFRAQAPGSVFDDKNRTGSGSGSRGSVTSTPTGSALGIGVHRPGHSGSVIKSPLKSALKASSRTPSPSTSRSATVVASGPRHGPEAARGTTMVGSSFVTPLTFSGTGFVKRGGSADEDGGEDESAYETGEEVFYSDEGEPTDPTTLSGGPTPAAVNGHMTVAGGDATTKPAVGTTIQKTLSTSITQSTHPQQQQTGQTSRKRKSVRVSLQPTFSPSPPAIEYGEREEDNRAATIQNHDSSQQNGSINRKQVQTSSKSNSWEDSTDEDEEYQKAKAALSRAAKKDKEVSESVTRTSLAS